MPPQTNTIQDIYKQIELDKLYAGKSSGDSGSLIAAMQGQQRLASMPQSGAIQGLTPIGPLDFLAETAITGASQMEDMNPLALLLGGALAPGAYKKLKTTNTPALLQKFDVKVEKVATMNRQGKLKEMTMKSGGRTIRTRGKRSGWKKAIITLKEGYSIDLIRGESGV